MRKLPGSTRPFTARIVLWGGALLGLLNLGRAVALWRQEDWLTGLPISPDPRVRMAAALGWALLFSLATGGLWLRREWARVFVPLLLALYGVYELGMIVLHTSTFPAMLPVVVYCAFVGLAGWTLWRPHVRTFFQRKGDR